MTDHGPHHQASPHDHSAGDPYEQPTQPIPTGPPSPVEVEPVADESRSRETSQGRRSAGPPGQTDDVPAIPGPTNGLTTGYVRTPLYAAQHGQRYARQQLIREYESLTGARLVVMIDTIFSESVTYLEEVLRDVDRTQPLHLLLASPGGDGEVAVRLVRALQARCSELLIIVPDMAKSAGTIMCLGANRILMSPSSDLGPIDPQFRMNNSLYGAKEIEAAVASAEQRVQAAPDTYPLYSGLLTDVNMLMLETARSAMRRSYSLLRDALECSTADADQVTSLIATLKGPLVDDAQGHTTTIGPQAAIELGLPVDIADTDSPQWQLIWALWTHYFALGCFPVGVTAVYENSRASQVIGD